MNTTDKKQEAAKAMSGALEHFKKGRDLLVKSKKLLQECKAETKPNATGGTDATVKVKGIDIKGDAKLS